MRRSATPAFKDSTHGNPDLYSRGQSNHRIAANERFERNGLTSSVELLLVARMIIFIVRNCFSLTQNANILFGTVDCIATFLLTTNIAVRLIRGHIAFCRLERCTISSINSVVWSLIGLGQYCHRICRWVCLCISPSPCEGRFYGEQSGSNVPELEVNRVLSTAVVPAMERGDSVTLSPLCAPDAIRKQQQ